MVGVNVAVVMALPANFVKYFVATVSLTVLTVFPPILCRRIFSHVEAFSVKSTSTRKRSTASYRSTDATNQQIIMQAEWLWKRKIMMGWVLE